MRRVVLLVVLLILCAVPVVAQDNLEDNPLIEALSYGESRLDDVWYVFYVSDLDNFASFGWANDASSVIVISHLTFTDPDAINGYFDKDYFDVTFENYLPYKKVDACQSEGVTRIEFSGQYQDTPYNIWHYHWNLTPETLQVVTLYFPASELDDMSEHAELLQPALTTCSDDN